MKLRGSAKMVRVHFGEDDRWQGKPLHEAIREASIGRVRPKLMTASTAICGLLPILLLRMHGTEIERPLAIVMTGGLVTSTIFILLVLPTIYPWFTKRAKRKGG